MYDRAVRGWGLRLLLAGAVLLTVAAAGVAHASTASHWKRVAQLPDPENLAAPAVVNGKVYLVGGESNGEYGYDTIQAFTPSTGTWAMAPFKLPVHRWGPEVAVVNSLIYVVGGNANTFDFFATANAYVIDPRTGTVTRIAPMPIRTSVGVAVPVSIGGQDELMVIGGVQSVDGPEQSADNPVHEPTPVYAYSPKTNTWKRLASLPGKNALDYGWAVNDAHTVYYWGGTQDLIYGPVNRTMYRYDATANTWEKETTLPTPLAGMAAGAVGADGRIYLVGTDGKGRQVRSYAPGGTWRTGPAIPHTLGPRTVAVFDWTLYALGGTTLDRDGEAFVAPFAWTLQTKSP